MVIKELVIITWLALARGVSSKAFEDGMHKEIFALNNSLPTTTGEFANLAACECGWRNSQANSSVPTLQIVGGTETGVNEFPAMAGLINTKTLQLFCGAHIISNRYLLTAAHCLYQRSTDTLAVVVGEHSLQTGTDTSYAAIYSIEAYEIYPFYIPATYAYDFAILRTATDIVFSNYVGPICLPFTHTANRFINESVTILGWGATEFTGALSDVLLEATLGVISNTQCALDSGSIILIEEICTYASGKDSCQSDSGGPILWTDSTTNRMHLVGIISHGVGCASNDPGINARVTSFLPWLTSRTSDATYCSV